VRQRALLLINRHARKGQESLTEAVECLQNQGLELFEESTEHPQHLSETIRHYVDRVDLVIVGGGDGTLNAAIAGLVETKLPLGILPLGTANDLARTLEIPTALPQACEVIATGEIQNIDLGWVNGHYFFNVASLGLSVQITRKLNKEAKRRWGILAYALAAVQVLWQSRLFWADIQVDGQSHWVRTAQIAVGNGRHYGGGMTVAAEAAIDDQQLDVYSLEIQHWWQMIALLPAMRRGNQASWPWVHTFQGQEVQIVTRRGHAINTDGEITTSTPAQFRVIPNALSIICP
jgi:diacylglycerol kinase (ATP)